MFERITQFYHQATREDVACHAGNGTYWIAIEGNDHSTSIFFATKSDFVAFANQAKDLADRAIQAVTEVSE